MAGKLPPGSLGLPFLGETLALAWNNHAFFRKRFEKYGPVFKTRLFGSPVVVFIGPEAFPFFLDPNYFTREGSNPRHMQELLDWESLPLIDGDKHRTRKRLVLEAFRPEALGRYVPVIEKTVRLFLERWERKGEITWVSEYRDLSAVLSSALLIGKEPGSGNDGIGEVIETYLKGFTSMPVNLHFNTYGKALRSRDELLARISKAIAEHRSRPFQDMLGELIEARADGGAPLTDEQLRREVLHLFFAAYGGIYISLTFLSLTLAQFPEVMARAREEVRRQAPEGPLSLEVLQKLTFLDQVAREIRRYYPINSVTFFARVKQALDFHGYHVPEKWLALGGIYTTLHDPKAFANPDTFDPGRFEPGRPGQNVAACYVPQGGGPREGHRCPGEDLITVLMKSVAVLLLRDYTWDLPPQDLGLSRDLFPIPKSGLVARFRREPSAAVKGDRS